GRGGRERWMRLAGKRTGHRDTESQSKGSQFGEWAAEGSPTEGHPDPRTRNALVPGVSCSRIAVSLHGAYAPLAELNGPHCHAARASSHPRRDKSSVNSAAPFPRRGGDCHRRALKHWTTCGVGATAHADDR